MTRNEAPGKVGHPFGVRYALTPTWFNVVKSLAQGTNARLILGVNLEADRKRFFVSDSGIVVIPKRAKLEDVLAERT